MLRRGRLTVAGDHLSVGAGETEDAAIWLIGFDDHHDVAIERGENRGRTLRYHHVVREITSLGRWHGKALELALPLIRLAAEGRGGAAILVQRSSDGVILAAARVPLTGQGSADRPSNTMRRVSARSRSTSPSAIGPASRKPTSE
jgi:hypothetical protein